MSVTRFAGFVGMSVTRFALSDVAEHMHFDVQVNNWEGLQACQL